MKWRVAALAAVLAAAAFLRFDALQHPSYWLDEILYQQLTAAAAAQPWWQWLTSSSAEHAGLYYLTQMVLPGRVAAALCGLATIVVVWLVARSVEPRAAFPAAIILAVSPLHVYYSREARSYALLMLLTALLVLIFLRARSLLALSVVLVAMLYTAALSAPVVAAASAIAVACAWATGERWYWKAAGASAAALPLFPLLYTASPYEETGWPPFPPLSLSFFETLLQTFTISALGAERGRLMVAVLVLALAMAGAVALARHRPVEAIVLIGMAVLPLVAAMVSLKALDHFFAARYVSPALVGFVVLAGVGLATLSRREVLAGVLAVVLVTQTWAAARFEPRQKLDWRGIAATIWKHARPGDIIIAAEPWSEVSLRYYLDRLPPRAQLVHIFAPEVADLQRAGRPHTWLVTAGFSSNPATRHWMCRFPLLLASPLENFRLHYASPVVDRNAPLFFGEGWADAEGAMRWSVARRAMVTIPRWSTHDALINVRVLPMAHDSLPAQILRVSLNGRALGQVTLPRGWSDQSFPAPGPFWVGGENTVAFESGHAVAPASLDAKATDHRTLAVAFERIEAGGTLARLTALLEPARDDTRFPPGRLRPDAVQALIARAGLDPNVIWPRIARGELRLDDVAETLAWDRDCGGDLRPVFRVLLEREPWPHEVRELETLPRERAIGRILKWDEFRRRVTTAP